MKFNSRAIAIIAAFTALSLVLSHAVSGISIPAPYFPVIRYEIWELPIAAAFFLFSPKHAVAITLLSGFALMIIVANPIYLGGILACFSMLLGPYLVMRFGSGKAQQGKHWSAKKTVAVCALLAALFRAASMVVFNVSCDECAENVGLHCRFQSGAVYENFFSTF